MDMSANQNVQESTWLWKCILDGYFTLNYPMQSSCYDFICECSHIIR